MSLKQKIKCLESLSFWDVQKVLDGRTFVFGSKDHDLSDVMLIRKDAVLGLLSEATKQIQGNTTTRAQIIADYITSGMPCPEPSELLVSLKEVLAVLEGPK